MKTLLICGWTGRMGTEAARMAAQFGFLARPFAPGETGDVTLDFSHPDCLEGLLPGAGPLVLGTTGYSPAQQAAIAAAARTRPVFQAANFSLGVCALERLACLARQLLPDWELSLIERHHAAKRDAPSGTARQLCAALGLPSDLALSVRAGTVPGIHEITLYGPGETLTLTHAAEGRAAFAAGALRAAEWLLSQPPGLYGMADMPLYKAVHDAE